MTTTAFFYMLTTVTQQSKVSDAIIYRICGETCIQTPTLLFLRTPLFLSMQGDKVIHTNPEDQTLFAAVLFLLLQEERITPIREPEKVLLVSQEELARIEAWVKTIPFKKLKRRKPALLGLADQAKKELPLLRHRSKGVITTPERLIDHIRLQNISVSKVKDLIIALPKPDDINRFERDILFIESKVSEKSVMTIYQEQGRVPTLIPDLLKHPTVVPQTQWRYSEASYVHYITPKIEQMITEFLYAAPYDQCAILAKTEDMVALKKALKLSVLITDNPDKIRKHDHIEFLIITHIQGEQSFDHLIEVLTNFQELQEVLFLLPPEETTQFHAWKEKQHMQSEAKERPSQEDIIAGKIRNMVNDFRTTADPETMKYYQRVIKKNTSFFDRGHLLTYLVAQMIDGKQRGAASPRGGEKSFARNGQKPQESREIESREGMQVLFVGAGKARGVFIGNIIHFFTSLGELEKEELGKIRVLPNYSFVEVPEEKVAQLVEKLDGQKIKGRPTKVNIAQKREDS